MLTITFIIYQAGGVIAEEPATGGQPLRYEDFFNSAETCEGALRITTNGARQELEDELPALIKNLCFEANREAGQKKQATYHFHSDYGQLTLSVQDGLLHLAGGETGTISYDYETFSRALYDCGNRFIGFLQQLECRDPQRQQHRDSLIELLQQARDNKE